MRRHQHRLRHHLLARPPRRHHAHRRRHAGPRPRRRAHALGAALRADLELRLGREPRPRARRRVPDRHGADVERRGRAASVGAAAVRARKGVRRLLGVQDGGGEEAVGVVSRGEAGVCA